MNATLLRLRGQPDQRLDLSALLPERIAGLSERELAALPVSTTRIGLPLGEAFDVVPGDPYDIRILGGSERLDRLGAGLSQGTIRLEGDAGIEAGLGMTGGTLTILGDAGPRAGALMSGGVLRVESNAGDFAGGTIPGAMAGMRGGLLVIEGSAGERAGDRMRRGVIAILGRTGDRAASRMRGGTLLAAEAGALPGVLMQRGTVILATGLDGPGSTFVSSGPHELQVFGVLRNWLSGHDPRLSDLVPRRAERFQGDMAALGRGEIFVSTL